VRSLTRRGDRGSTLLLFPAGVLVVMLLSAIAVDMSQLHTAQVDLETAVQSAADDAASMIDIDALRSTGQVSIDLEAARRTVADDLATASLTGSPGVVSVELGPRPDTLVVVATRHVRRLFGSAIPGVARTVTVQTHVTAEIRVR
jgi:hypothetical protein